MTLDREDLAWAAGFFDGEGNIRFNTRKNKNATNPKRLYGTPQISLAQVHKAALKRFQRAVHGLGNIYGPYTHGKQKKNPYWLFNTSSFEQAQAIVAMLWPWLGPVKRAQAKDALRQAKKYAQRPRLKTGPKPRTVAA